MPTSSREGFLVIHPLRQSNPFMLQTDQWFPGIDSNKEGLRKSPDGSVEIYIGTQTPKGMESNWIQSLPGNGWNVILRLYGPLDPWFDKTWMPGDFELVE